MFSCCSLLLLFCLARSSLSAGPGHTGNLEAIGWQSDPRGRGTFTLISSCVLTLTICVYSAMHLNVPPPGESIFRSWMRNIKWALLGIFGPEMVVFLAWQQYLSAKTLVQKSKNELNVKETLLQGEMVERQPETVLRLYFQQPHRIC